MRAHHPPYSILIADDNVHVRKALVQLLTSESDFQICGEAKNGQEAVDAAARGEFDAVVACYHDQGLIPVKLLAFGRSVNVTLGLPIIRTSVDHGTAFDIAGKGIADPSSMIEAVLLAARLSKPQGQPWGA